VKDTVHGLQVCPLLRKVPSLSHPTLHPPKGFVSTAYGTYYSYIIPS